MAFNNNYDGVSSPNLDFVLFGPAAALEPATLALAAIGLLTLLAIRRRRSCRSARVSERRNHTLF
jgi:MYXO-CTERM domain-containing protein